MVQTSKSLQDSGASAGSQPPRIGLQISTPLQKTPSLQTLGSTVLRQTPSGSHTSTVHGTRSSHPSIGVSGSQGRPKRASIPGASGGPASVIAASGIGAASSPHP